MFTATEPKNQVATESILPQNGSEAHSLTTSSEGLGGKKDMS